jgi:hypothetical protein
MNKLAMFVKHYRNLGSQQALSTMSGQEKTAFLGKLLPKSRLGKLGLGLAGLGGAGAAYKSMQDQPSTLENLYSGGKDALSNMSQEDLMGYANLIDQLRSGGGSSILGYGAEGGQVDPSMYAMSDMYPEDASSSMGYESQMSPEEAQAYLQYYS